MIPFLELFDETLDINSTENYYLTIQASPDGFAFAILDSIRNKYILLRSWEPDENKNLTADEVEDLIKKDDFLLRKYRKTSIIMPSPKFTLVPAPLFDPGKKEEYFSFNLIKEENEVVLSNKVADPDAFTVFAVNSRFHELCAQYFPGAIQWHHTKCLLAQMAHHSKSHSPRYIHLHAGREYFNVFIFENGVLKFSNTFRFRNISDILYYVLNIFRSRGLGNEETIHFSGNTEKFDDLYSAFAMYVRNLRFSDPSGNFTFSYVFNEIGLHKFINLFSVTNCE
jgi:hypothetical protein